LARVRAAIGAVWDELNTDWLLLDAELMPWSAKAAGLITNQYAPVGAAAAAAALTASVGALAKAQDRGIDVAELLARTRSRASNTADYRDAYRRYCWPTQGLRGVTLAPFQVLAAEGQSFATCAHSWHLAIADRVVANDPEVFTPTRRLVVDTTDECSVRAGITWWEDITAAGGEGMVVKPMANLVRGDKGLVQHGVKVRGREYLRIIYRPDYTEPRHLERLGQRSLERKRSLALREYALGLEALDWVAGGDPLWRVHECVFAVLAMESEPVDSRL
jgi:protein phosphatase